SLTLAYKTTPKKRKMELPTNPLVSELQATDPETNRDASLQKKPKIVGDTQEALGEKLHESIIVCEGTEHLFEILSMALSGKNFVARMTAAEYKSLENGLTSGIRLVSLLKMVNC